MQELDAAEFIVYYRTSSVDAALQSVPSKEAARTRAALRLRRRRGSVLYLIAERALYLEQLGADRAEAVQQLAGEYRLRLEERLKRIRDVYNFIVYAAAMGVFAAIVLGVVLGILSSFAAYAALAVLAVTVLAAFYLDFILPPVRKWSYGLAFLASTPAVAAMAIPQAAYATVPVAAAYFFLYYWPRYKAAMEEFDRAARGMAIAETPLGKAAARIARAVRDSGAFDLQATAEYLLRLYKSYLDSIRRDGLIRAAVVSSLVAIMALTVAWLYPQLAEIVAKAQEAGSQLPIAFNFPAAKMLTGATSLVAAFVAGRMTESYAAVPLYTPLTLAVLASP